MRQDAKEHIVYGHERSAKLTVHSQGFGVGFRKARINTASASMFYEAEAVSLRSLKELSLINTYYGWKTFVYGKLNSVVDLRGLVGQSSRISRKPSWGGVELRWDYSAGVSLAMVKPYYYYFFTNASSLQIVEGRFDDESIEWIDIYGRCPFSKGLSELRLSPGVVGRLSLNADFSKTKTRIKMIEVSANVEYFPLHVPIMYGQSEDRLYVTLGISYFFGVRYNKY